MDVHELRQLILENRAPKRLVIVDNCHTLTLEYIKAICKSFNRRPCHVYSIKDAKALNGRFDRRDLLGIVHSDLKDAEALNGITDIPYVFVVTEDTDTILPKVVFPVLNKNQCILYLENWLIENGFFKEEDAGDGSKKVKKPSLSRDNILLLLNYFDNDLDLAMGELRKLQSLEVTQLDAPFEALYECLPSKQQRLKSLPWYSGGAVDTAQVLYATYLKKLKAAGDMRVPVDKQLWYAQLITEAMFVKYGILTGTFGEYALEYFKLIEQMSPKDFKVQWLPPVSQSEVGEEWKY